MNTSVQWAAQLHGVQEVSMRGTADLAFWQNRLAPHGLAPEANDGRVAIMIVGASGRFAGVHFSEVSVSVSLAEPKSSAKISPGTTSSPLMLLECAFNSNRFFAWCERTFFSTPYAFAHVAIDDAATTSLQVQQHGETIFRASMQPNVGRATRQPAHQRDETWLARVLLPVPAGRTAEQRKMFFARILGTTYVYPYVAGEDTMHLAPLPNKTIFSVLAESHFTPTEWIVRPNASHAKSKTYSMRNLAGNTAWT